MIARFVARRAVTQAAVWGTVFALFTYVSAIGYAASYRTAAARAVFARTLGANSGLTMLFGRAHHIDTVAGFTEWRGCGLLALVASVWAVLTSTRMLRGEEEAGRWELLLAGPVTRRRAAIAASTGLGVAWSALFAATTAGTFWTAHSSQLSANAGACLAYGFAICMPAAVFLCTGILTSQLTHTRRHAAMAAGGALGVSVALRMLADSGRTLRWLGWVSPLGWSEKMQPLTNSRWAPLALLTALAGLVLLAAWFIAGRRDIGVGLLQASDDAAAHTRLLGSSAGLAIRIARPLIVGWCLGLGVLGVLFGLVAKAAAQAVSGSAEFRRTLEQLGGTGSGPRAYLGVTFVVGATLVMLIAAGRVVDIRDEEGSGRADNLLVRPVRRGAWFVQHLAVAAASCLLAAEVLAMAEYAGTTAQHAGVSFGRLAVAGVNAMPTSVVLLGVGALVCGIAPRRTAFAVYGLVAWSFLVEFLAQLVNSLHWLRGTSLLFHMAPAPAADPNWTSAAVLVGIGLSAAALGTAAFARRDLAGA